MSKRVFILSAVLISFVVFFFCSEVNPPIVTPLAYTFYQDTLGLDSISGTLTIYAPDTVNFGILTNMPGDIQAITATLTGTSIPTRVLLNRAGAPCRT